MQELQVELTDKELYCMLLILVREPEKSQQDQSPQQTDVNSETGFIVYN